MTTIEEKTVYYQELKDAVKQADMKRCSPDHSKKADGDWEYLSACVKLAKFVMANDILFLPDVK